VRRGLLRSENRSLGLGRSGRVLDSLSKTAVRQAARFETMCTAAKTPVRSSFYPRSIESTNWVCPRPVP
jgi:hypothetical protein